MRTLGKAMLENAGFDVVTASDGQQALDVFAARRDEIVCVVLDLTMPVMDGVRLCQLIRALDNLRNVRIVVVSGMLAEDVRDELGALGITRFVAKPFKVDELFEAIES